MGYDDRFETDALVIRRHAPDDWEALREYGRYRGSIEFDRWESWPTDEKGAKDVAAFFADADNFWAVERREDGAWLGFISFNEITAEGHLDMGHGLLPGRARQGEIAEALRRMVDYAFTLPGVVAVEARNPEGWAEQVEPVAALGFAPFEHGRILRKAQCNGVETTDRKGGSAMITGIAHGAYHTSDMDKTIDFYCGKLGLKEAFRFTDDAGNPRLVYIHIPGTMQFLEFFPAREGTKEVAGTFYAHICLAVDDAAATCKALEERGVTITTPLKMGGDGNWQFWTKDPDGNPIEFMQMMPDSKQAQAAKG